jgi:uncharacterized protein YyaL (SSP411 family)
MAARAAATGSFADGFVEAAFAIGAGESMPASVEARKPNRLAEEASPYLLQHAHNPVDWWPWSAEALSEAKRRDVPILLSIGYSACHWCHVMERESFEHEAIAALMNEHFVNIKVDREERPDLDQIYQLVVQLMGKTGGWPLTVFLTPAQKPFYGGTYFPPEDRYGMPGFPKILTAIAEAYRERRGEVAEQADELTQAITEVGRGNADEQEAYAPGPDLLDRAADALMRRFDDENGGFGKRPKFPNTMPLELLLRHVPSRDAARRQLEAMRRGGIWDHLGGGFHRYSTDEHWLVPHFEKMLYDNALLLRSYIDGFRVFGNELFAATARDIAAYVAREMTDASGGFYASQDADSEGEEGKFFVWDITDVEQMFGKDSLETKVALEHFGITRAGNFEDHGRPTFKTVLHEKRPIGEHADVLARVKARLFTEREKRPKPFRDEKILTSWSSLMISSLADAGVALREPAMVTAAERALDFVEKTLVDAKTGRPLRLAKDGQVKGPGFLDDHAYLVNAAIDVYEATGDLRRLTLARNVADAALVAFSDPEEGFFFTPKDGESLIARQKDPFDHATPSGFSMICRALLRLGALVDAKYAAIAEKELVAIAPAAIANPFGYGQSLCELDRLVRGNVDVVVVGDRSDDRTRALVAEAFRTFLPNRTISWGDGPLAEGKEAKDVPVAYVCRGRTCSLPVKTPDELRALLEASPS